MTGEREGEESVVDLFDRVEVIEQGSHRTRFGVDVTLGHREVVRAEDTFAWTSKWLRQDLDGDDTRL